MGYVNAELGPRRYGADRWHLCGMGQQRDQQRLDWLRDGPEPRVITLNTNITAGALNFGTTGYSINTGGNTLTLNRVGSGVGTVNLGGGTLALKNDGDGTGSLQTLNFLENVAIASESTITIAHAATAANKDLQLGTLSLGGNQLNVSNSNGFSLEFTGP